MRKFLALIIIGLLGFYVAWPAWSGYRIASALKSGDESVLASKIDFGSVRESLRPTVSQEVDKRLTQQMAAVGGGAAGQMLSGDIKTKLMPKMVDGVLETLVTPANIIRIANESGGMAKAVEKIVGEQASKLSGGIGGLIPGGGALPGIGGSGGGGGLPGLGGLGSVLGGGASAGLPAGLPGLPGLGRAPAPAPAPAAAPAAPKPVETAKASSFGLGNLKGFSMDGPLGFAVSLAKDAASSKHDVTAGMAFRNFDWKLVKVVPNL